MNTRTWEAYTEEKKAKHGEEQYFNVGDFLINKGEFGIFRKWLRWLIPQDEDGQH